MCGSSEERWLAATTDLRRRRPASVVGPHHRPSPRFCPGHHLKANTVSGQSSVVRGPERVHRSVVLRCAQTAIAHRDVHIGRSIHPAATRLRQPGAGPRSLTFPFCLPGPRSEACGSCRTDPQATVDGSYCVGLGAPSRARVRVPRPLRGQRDSGDPGVRRQRLGTTGHLSTPGARAEAPPLCVRRQRQRRRSTHRFSVHRGPDCP